MKRHRKPLPEELKMIRKIAWSYSRSTGLEYDELFSEACLAYLESLGHYDPSKGKISTYLHHVVNNSLNNLIYKNNRKNNREIITEDKDFDFLASDISHNPEQMMIAEENWAELCMQLSPEAMMVVEIMNSGDVYVSANKKQVSRRHISNALKDAGWKQSTIWRTFREIKRLVAATA